MPDTIDKTSASLTPLLTLPDPSALPKHVAIIMDGNGRWARRQGLSRSQGHQAGAQAVRPIVTECSRLGIQALTLYSFSVENWKRPADEIAWLMELYVAYLKLERQTMRENNIRFRQIGQREGLPQPVLDELDRTTEETKHNTGLTLALAINYGSRREITDAVRAIAQKVQAGTLQLSEISESTIDEHLYTAGLPDPDLLIRTAGERRVSNYLLWQISYAEIYVADVCWPDFDLTQFHHSLIDFAKRQRKFGQVEPCHQSR